MRKNHPITILDSKANYVHVDAYGQKLHVHYQADSFQQGKMPSCPDCGSELAIREFIIGEITDQYGNSTTLRPARKTAIEDAVLNHLKTTGGEICQNCMAQAFAEN